MASAAVARDVAGVQGHGRGVVPGLEGVRGQLRRLVKVRERLTEAARPAEGFTAGEEDREEFRLEFDDLAEGGDGFVQLLLGDQERCRG